MYIDRGGEWGCGCDRRSLVSGDGAGCGGGARRRSLRGVEVSGGDRVAVGGDRADGVWGRFRFDDNRRNYRQIIVKLSSKAVG